MRSRLVSLLLAASMCLTLGGCGGLSGLMGGIIIEPSGHSDGESHTPDLNYSGAQGSELCVEVYSLEEGDWSGPAPALSLPVSGSASRRPSPTGRASAPPPPTWASRPRARIRRNR